FPASTATAFGTLAPVEGDKFKLLSGRPKTYIKTAESGNKRTQMFCPKCGTPICSGGAGGEPPIYVRLAPAQQRAARRPKVQYWSRSAQHWLTGLGSLTRIEKQ